MSVAGLPDAGPARVAPAIDDAPVDASASAAGAFSETLHARVTQSEREERHTKRGVPAAAVAVVAEAPPPTETRALALPGVLVPSNPAGQGAAVVASASVAAAARAPVLGAPSGGPADASPDVSGTRPAEVGASARQLPPSAAMAKLAAAAGRLSTGDGGAAMPLSALPSLKLTDAEALALASSPPSGMAAASSAAGAFAKSKPSAAAPELRAVAPTSGSMAASTAGSDPTSAKSVTVVNQPASGTLTTPDGARGRLRDAMSFVANQAVLRKGAVGELDVPELGRVVIRAEKGGGGNVDVHITADRPETRSILHASTTAMAVDLNEANVPLGQIVIDAPSGGGVTADRGAPGDDTRRARTAGRRADKENAAPTPGAKSRVRIVL